MTDPILTAHSSLAAMTLLRESAPANYCECGCGSRTTIARNGRPYRFVHGHYGRGTGNVLNFISDEKGCWVWQGSINWKGYGQLRFHSKAHMAHRFLYEYLRGPIPRGLVIDHLCRNRACVNPDHLEPVTPAENSRRGDAWKTNGLKTHCPQGHPYEGKNLYLKKSGGRVCRACQQAADRAYRARKKHAAAGS